MALNADLVAFIKESLRQGQKRDQIQQVLADAGWPVGQVRRALARFADIEFPVPVPRPATSTRPREAFLYVVMFMALFVGSFSFGGVLFALVDLTVPDPAAVPPEIIRELLRWSISQLVVACPLFLFMSRVIRRGIEAQPGGRRSKIRLQLTYLTLFVGSCVLIGTVAALVHSLLGGDLTTRFVLKALSVAGIAGCTSAYYLMDLRESERDPRGAADSARRARLPLIAAAVVTVFVVAGIVQLGPPADQRSFRLDMRRAQDLQGISSAVDRYEATHERLPESLDELLAGSNMRVASKDPVTDDAYEYLVGEGSAYQLCAVFATNTENRDPRTGGPFSRHAAGRHCFQLRAQRDRD